VTWLWRGLPGRRVADHLGQLVGVNRHPWASLHLGMMTALNCESRRQPMRKRNCFHSLLLLASLTAITVSRYWWQNDTLAWAGVLGVMASALWSLAYFWKYHSNKEIA
jgi:hypothetical protein